MDFMEQEDENNASDTHHTTLQLTDEQFPQEKGTYSKISDTKDQEISSAVLSLKRRNRNLSDDIVSKKQRTEVYLSEINSNKIEDICEVQNFVKASCTHITTSTADSYDTIGEDNILNTAEHGLSQNLIIEQNGQNKLFDSTFDEMNRVKNFVDETSNEILLEVANAIKDAINSTPNGEKEHDAEISSTGDKTSNKAPEVIKVDMAPSWLKQTLSDNSSQHSVENLAYETGAQEIAEPNVNMEQMILSWSLNELLKRDDETLSTEPMVRDSDVSVDLLKNVPLGDRVKSFSIELPKLEDCGIIPTFPVVKDSGMSVNLLETSLSNGIIHSSDSLSELDEKEKNDNIEHDLVSDLKPLQFCTQNALSEKIGTPEVVESNDVSNNFETHLVQQAHEVFNNLPDFQKNFNQSIVEDFPDSNQLHKCKNEKTVIEEIQPLSCEKTFSIKSSYLNSERCSNEEVCSHNQLAPIEYNSSEIIQEVPNFDTYYKKLTATKLDPNLKETKEISDLDFTSPENSYEIETNFDTEQEVDMMEIDCCNTTMTTNYQTYKPDQRKETININLHEEQMECISNEGKCNENQIDDKILSLHSTDKSSLDKSMSSAPIVDSIIRSSFSQDSGKIANEASRYEDSLFNPLKEITDNELLISACNADKSANSYMEFLNSTAPACQNYYFETEILSNEENLKCIESTSFLKEIEDGDKGSSGTFSEQCEEISSTDHSSAHRFNPIKVSSTNRSLLTPNTVDKKISKCSSKRSLPFPESNRINEVIEMYLENHIRKDFSVQDVVNFVMEQFETSVSYFDAIHSARIFLRNALNAEMLKMKNGKYVMKSSGVRTT